MTTPEKIEHAAPTYVDMARQSMHMANEAAQYEVAEPALLVDRVTGLSDLVQRVAEQIGHVGDTAEILPAAARDADGVLTEDPARGVTAPLAVQDLRAAVAQLAGVVDTLTDAGNVLGRLRIEPLPPIDP